MPIRHAIWKVGSRPEPLTESSLASEQLLETMIVAQPKIVSDAWMLIGRRVEIAYDGSRASYAAGCHPEVVS